jgi:hypothetical protein
VRARTPALAIAFAILGCQETTAVGAGWRDSPFGVSLRSGMTSEVIRASLPLAHQAGASWVRVFVPFGNFHPREDAFVWGWMDSVVTAASTARVRVLAVVIGSPRWNTTAPADAIEPADSCTKSALSRYPPSRDQQWANDVGQLVTRYSGRIAAYEIWNEPDIDALLAAPGMPCPEHYWCGTPADYARLAALTSRSIHAADPSAKVVMGGLGLATTGSFLREILGDAEYPAARTFDVANMHFYGSPSDAAAYVNAVRSQLAVVHADSMPIWVTETGYSSEGVDGLALQSDYLGQILPEFVRLGVERVFWFQLVDPQDSFAAPGCPVRIRPERGLLTSDMRRKPAFDQFRSIAVPAP